MHRYTAQDTHRQTDVPITHYLLFIQQRYPLFNLNKLSASRLRSSHFFRFFVVVWDSLCFVVKNYDCFVLFVFYTEECND